MEKMSRHNAAGDGIAQTTYRVALWIAGVCYSIHAENIDTLTELGKRFENAEV